MSLDLITIGRSSVDFHGGQVGGRLEDMRSFYKYIGGSPTNIAAGAARLGLSAGLITRVGDEHMGRFIREQLIGEGVDVRGVTTDPDRLTALVLLGIKDREQFPLTFYRSDCADMALCEDDVDPDYIATTRCVCVTGAHLSHPSTEAAVLKALRLARVNGARTALDIDYRPILRGVVGHDEGESRFVASDDVTAKLLSTLHLFDLIVGTEEEFHIAGGTTDTLAALMRVRDKTGATLICKHGPIEAIAFTGAIGKSLDEGLSGPGFPVEVFNVLGAGDSFMAGLLSGWLEELDWTTTLTRANACGALTVSRHGCASAFPGRVELDHFLDNGFSNPALRHDRELEQLHWSSNRIGEWGVIRIFAFDHRRQLEAMADEHNVEHARIARFKSLCLQAALGVRDERARDRADNRAAGYGILCDSRLGEEALFAAGDTGLWTGRPVELPGSRPLQLEAELGADYGSALAEWPRGHVVKVLCFCHPDDDETLRDSQEATLLRLFEATRANGLEFLLEIIATGYGPLDDMTTARQIDRIYRIGIYPDWWKLEPLRGTRAWAHVCDAIERHDPHVRGIVVLGLDASPEALEESFGEAARFPLVKGFAVGRTIFGQTARRWFAGEIEDADAIIEMQERFTALCDAWDKARGTAS